MPLHLWLSVGVVIVGMVSLSPSTIAASDALCARLRDFETAPFEKGHDDKPIRRSVTFLWLGPWEGENMKWGCNHGASDGSGKQFCDYLTRNTSLEFRGDLPARAMNCYGSGLPPGTLLDWNNWTASIKLRDNVSDRTMLMEVDLSKKAAPDGAVRISVIPENPSVDDEAEPNLDIHPAKSSNSVSGSSR